MGHSENRPGGEKSLILESRNELDKQATVEDFSAVQMTASRSLECEAPEKEQTAKKHGVYQFVTARRA
jgi:hypothetical protein